MNDPEPYKNCKFCEGKLKNCPYHPTPPEYGAFNEDDSVNPRDWKDRGTPQDTAQVIPQWRNEEPWISIEGVLIDCREFQLTIIESEEEIKKHVDTFLHSQLQMILERVKGLHGMDETLGNVEKLLLDAIGE